MIDFEALSAPLPPERVSRFADKIEADTNGGCWLWSGSANAQGYGNFWHDGKCWKAHRFSFALAHGSVDPEMDVLHSCDNPSCVNPSHLRIGTARDNMLDMFAKGRAHDRKGIKNPKSKLTSESLAEIKKWLSARAPTWAIADFFGISTSQVRRIARGECHG